MKLNVGCGGKKYSFYDLKCDVNCDIQKPADKIPNFVQCDVRNLPFKDKAFQCIYAFNVLEHVTDYLGALSELNRVSSDEVLIRLDKIYNLANWFTSDHEDIAVQNALVPSPKPVKLFIRLVRFPMDNSKTFQSVVHASFPILRKLGLLDKWNYYRVK
jgi:ubiquinone/menaquinone biosynthesis C-methylase UbiE